MFPPTVLHRPSGSACPSALWLPSRSGFLLFPVNPNNPSCKQHVLILISEHTVLSRGWQRDFLRARGHHHGRWNSGRSLVEGFQQRWSSRSLPFQLCGDHLKDFFFFVFFQRQFFVSFESVPALRDQKLWGIQQRELKHAPSLLAVPQWRY